MTYVLQRSSRRLVLAFLVIAIALGGCDSSSRSPTAPIASSGPLVVQSFQTATQVELSAVRVQLRVRVVSGLDSLRQATQSGFAVGRVCQGGSCDELMLTTSFSEPSCAGVIPLGLAAAWLDDDVVGVDFCIPEVTVQEVYATSLGDGMSESNVVQTICSPSTFGVTCFSG